MSIDAINSNINTTSFQGEGKKSGSAAFPITLGVLGAGAGYFYGQPINAAKVLKEDKFELSEKALKDLTPEQVIAKESIENTLSEAKTAKQSATEFVDNMFGKGAKELSVDDVLKKTSLGTIENKEQLEKEIKQSETEIEKLTKDVLAADENLKKATDEASKKAAEKAKNVAEIQLSNEKEMLKRTKSHQDIISGATDGKISKDVLTKRLEKIHLENAEEAISNDLKTLGKKAGRMFSAKNAAIYGGIALVGGFILKALFGGKKEA